MRFKVINRVARMPAQWRLRLLQKLARWGVREDMLLVVIAALIGVGVGVSTWIFQQALELTERFYFVALTQWPKPWATSWWLLLLPLLPASGGLAVVVIRRLFRVPHTKLHGVSGVLYALIRKASTLRPGLGVESLLTSVMTIGTGGSAGPEAPIAVIGASVGSLIGSSAGISRRNLPILIGCGAAAGISAIFNAPISGVLFALEVLLRDFSVRTFSPIVISSVVATVMYQNITGGAGGGGLFANSVSAIPYHFTFHLMPYYLALGVVCGGLAVLLTWTWTFVEHRSEKLTRFIPQFWHPALGAALSGVCGVIIILMFRNDPYLGGVLGEFAKHSYVPIFADGYPTIHRALDPHWFSGMVLPSGQVVTLTIEFLVAASLLKILATAFTLGSGGSGGVFAPALFIGATAGGAVGMAFQHFNGAIAPYAFALVGMGGVIAAAIQAPLMSIILLFELTRNYQIMLPAMLAVVTATAIQQWLIRDSLYTLPLRLEGVRIGLPVGASALRRVGVDQLEIVPVRSISANTPVAEILRSSNGSPIENGVAMDDKGHYLGIITATDLRLVEIQPDAAPLLLAGEVVRTDVPPLVLSDSAERAFELLARSDLDFLPVFSELPHTAAHLRGMLTRAALMRRYHAELSG